MDAVRIQTDGDFLQGCRNNEVRVAMGVKEHAAGLPSPPLSQGHLGAQGMNRFALLIPRRVCVPRESQTSVKTRSLVSILGRHLSRGEGNGKKPKSRLEMRMGKLDLGNWELRGWQSGALVGPGGDALGGWG